MKRYLIALVAFMVLVSPLSAAMIENNKVLSWSTSAGQNGSIKIVAVNGQYFEADQTNEKNRAAGVIKLYGATLDGGKKIVLINTGQWKEIWEGTVSGAEINGNLIAGSAKYTFKITEPVIAAVASVKMEAGEYQAVHRHWTDKVIFSDNGTYKRAVNNDPGTYTFDGKTLVLNWAKWPAETLVMTAPGVFSSSAYQFTLTKATASTITVPNPFVNGSTLTWNTSAGQNGTILVTSVSGAKFTLDQINFNNRGAGTTKLDGEVKDGKIYIYNRQWNETWVGTLANNKIAGKINNMYDFTINMTAQTAVPVIVAVANPFVNGTTLSWNTSAGQNGTILVTSVSGAKFNLDQINFNNRGAGTTKLDGEVKDGKIYIYNRQWNETWVGTLANNKIAGKINNMYDFTINMTAQTAIPAVVSTEPFVQGKTLKWNTSAGQNGTILVTSVSGTKFTLDQINFNNRGAGTTKLDGEIKDGKIYIYNRQWNETWVGTNNNGIVTGKINNSYGFTINQ